MAMHKDPLNCKVYQTEGCSHVDGYLCDYPTCSILNDYMNDKGYSLGSIEECNEFSKKRNYTYEGQKRDEVSK